MSDQKLRELERRWRETGSLEDEVSLLRERVRTGRLPLLRLQAAARLEYPPATTALDNQAAPSLEEALTELGKEAWVRLGRATLRAGLPDWDGVSADRRPHEALAIVNSWLTCRSARDQARRQAGEFMREAQYVAGAAPAVHGPAGWVLRVALAVASTVWSTNRRVASQTEKALLVAAARGDDEPDGGVEHGLRHLRAVQEDLVPWLLGYFDPVVANGEAPSL